MLEQAKERLWRASEFAALTGVTVRTLHHYDRAGLLKPARRTAAGYRLYGAGDFARLQQILTLKFIGLPLEEIKGLLGGRALDLSETLRLQREALTEKRRQLDMALRAVTEAERVAVAVLRPHRPKRPASGPPRRRTRPYLARAPSALASGCG